MYGPRAKDIAVHQGTLITTMVIVTNVHQGIHITAMASAGIHHVQIQITHITAMASAGMDNDKLNFIANMINIQTNFKIFR